MNFSLVPPFLATGRQDPLGMYRSADKTAAAVYLAFRVDDH
ncbi:hypothetical protein LC55x_4889 [Lysobacter capsici]|nr:hypothetical protein LC55x_4889 [Lysobacter capsici]